MKANLVSGAILCSLILIQSSHAFIPSFFSKVTRLSNWRPLDPVLASSLKSIDEDESAISAFSSDPDVQIISEEDDLIASIKQETKSGNLKKAQGLWRDYVSTDPTAAKFVEFAKWAERDADNPRLARSIFESMLTDLEPSEVKQSWVFQTWARFEERNGQQKRANIIRGQLEALEKEASEGKNGFVNIPASPAKTPATKPTVNEIDQQIRRSEIIDAIVELPTTTLASDLENNSFESSSEPVIKRAEASIDQKIIGEITETLQGVESVNVGEVVVEVEESLEGADSVKVRAIVNPLSTSRLKDKDENTDEKTITSTNTEPLAKENEEETIDRNGHDRERVVQSAGEGSNGKKENEISDDAKQKRNPLSPKATSVQAFVKSGEAAINKGKKTNGVSNPKASIPSTKAATLPNVVSKKTFGPPKTTVSKTKTAVLPIAKKSANAPNSFTQSKKAAPGPLVSKKSSVLKSSVSGSTSSKFSNPYLKKTFGDPKTSGETKLAPKPPTTQPNVINREDDSKTDQTAAPDETEAPKENKPLSSEDSMAWKKVDLIPKPSVKTSPNTSPLIPPKKVGVVPESSGASATAPKSFMPSKTTGPKAAVGNGTASTSGFMPPKVGVVPKSSGASGVAPKSFMPSKKVVPGPKAAVGNGTASTSGFMPPKKVGVVPKSSGASGVAPKSFMPSKKVVPGPKVGVVPKSSATAQKSFMPSKKVVAGPKAAVGESSTSTSSFMPPKKVALGSRDDSASSTTFQESEGAKGTAKVVPRKLSGLPKVSSVQPFATKRSGALGTGSNTTTSDSNSTKVVQVDNSRVLRSEDESLESLSMNEDDDESRDAKQPDAQMDAPWLTALKQVSQGSTSESKDEGSWLQSLTAKFGSRDEDKTGSNFDPFTLFGSKDNAGESPIKDSLKKTLGVAGVVSAVAAVSALSLNMFADSMNAPVAEGQTSITNYRNGIAGVASDDIDEAEVDLEMKKAEAMAKLEEFKKKAKDYLPKEYQDLDESSESSEERIAVDGDSSKSSNEDATKSTTKSEEETSTTTEVENHDKDTPESDEEDEVNDGESVEAPKTPETSLKSTKTIWNMPEKQSSRIGLTPRTPLGARADASRFSYNKAPLKQGESKFSATPFGKVTSEKPEAQRQENAEATLGDELGSPLSSSLQEEEEESPSEAVSSEVTLGDKMTGAESENEASSDESEEFENKNDGAEADVISQNGKGILDESSANSDTSADNNDGTGSIDQESIVDRNAPTSDQDRSAKDDIESAKTEKPALATAEQARQSSQEQIPPNLQEEEKAAKISTIPPPPPPPKQSSTADARNSEQAPRLELEQKESFDQIQIPPPREEKEMLNPSSIAQEQKTKSIDDDKKSIDSSEKSDAESNEVVTMSSLPQIPSSAWNDAKSLSMEGALMKLEARLDVLNNEVQTITDDAQRKEITSLAQQAVDLAVDAIELVKESRVDALATPKSVYPWTKSALSNNAPQISSNQNLADSSSKAIFPWTKSSANGGINDELAKDTESSGQGSLIVEVPAPGKADMMALVPGLSMDENGVAEIRISPNLNSPLSGDAETQDALARFPLKEVTITSSPDGVIQIRLTPKA